MAFRPTEQNIQMIRDLYQQQVPVQQIALVVHCSFSTAERWVQRIAQEGLREGDAATYDRRKHNGAANKIRAEELDAAVAILEENPFAAASQLPNLLGINVTAESMRKALKDRAGLKNFKAAAKPALRNPNFVARQEFAEQHSDWTFDEHWSRTVCMDEKLFTTEKDCRSRVWRPEGLRYEVPYVIRKNHSGRIHMNCWGWISASGPGNLVEIDMRLHAEGYEALLEGWLLPGVEEKFPDEETVYIIEDNSPVHTARRIRQWYVAHPRLRRLPWPARSPDLNPIENLWSEMLRDWTPDRATNYLQLRNEVTRAWYNIGNKPNYCHSLLNSMSHRLQAVINARGVFTNY